MGPLFNPITWVLAFVVLLILASVLTLPGLVISVAVGGLYYVFSKGEKAQKVAAAVLLGVLTQVTLSLMLIPLVPVMFLVALFIGGFLMVL